MQATQSDGQRTVARGNFEIVAFVPGGAPRVKNIVLLVGDGLGGGADQLFDDRGLTGLTLLMGGGRQWFLPAAAPVRAAARRAFERGR